LRVVDPARTGMAAGISNTARITGLAMGVAGFGAFLQQRVGTRLTAAGFPGKQLAASVSSSGLRAARGRPDLAKASNVAFVSGFRLIILIGFGVVLVGALASAFLVRKPAELPLPALEPAP
jgi:hypothetical protein